jgi:MFS family permease
MTEVRPPQAGGPAGARGLPSTRLVTLAIVGQVTFVAFEALAVATAMPLVAEQLGAVRSYSLAFSLFMTASLLGMVVAGGLADSRGPTGPLVGGMLLFAGGLVVCGTATTFPVLLAGRVVSGAGAGALVVALYVVVAAVYPEDARPRVFGWVSAAWVVPAVVGPPVAGWLAAEISWRAVFLLVPPVALLSLAVLLPQVRRFPVPAPSAAGGGPVALTPLRRALLGLALAVGAGLVQWAVQHVVPPTPLPVLAGVAGLALVAAGLPPLMPRGTLRVRRGLPSVVVVRGLYTAAFFGAETYVPLALHQEKGLSLTRAGLALTAGALGWALGSWLQGRPGLRVPRHGLLALGAGFVAAGVAGLGLSMLPGASPWLAAPVWAVGAVGMGLAMSSTSVLVLGMSPPPEQGRNSASLQISDSLGAVGGVGLGGAVFAAGHDPGGSDAGLFAAIWLGLAAVALVGVAVGWRGRPA